MKYIEGVVEDISEKGVLCRARLEGSNNFEDVIVIDCYVTIRENNNNKTILKCGKGLIANTKVNEVKYIYYDYEGIKEMYSNKNHLLNRSPS